MDGKGDWTRAHESAQRDEGPEGSWVHAYLHRKEADQSNAAYWYGRARSRPTQKEKRRVLGEMERLNAALAALGGPGNLGGNHKGGRLRARVSTPLVPFMDEKH